MQRAIISSHDPASHHPETLPIADPYINDHVWRWHNLHIPLSPQALARSAADALFSLAQ